MRNFTSVTCLEFMQGKIDQQTPSPHGEIQPTLYSSENSFSEKKYSCLHLVFYYQQF